jgi:hypothetical protein
VNGDTESNTTNVHNHKYVYADTDRNIPLYQIKKNSKQIYLPPPLYVRIRFASESVDLSFLMGELRTVLFFSVSKVMITEQLVRLL